MKSSLERNLEIHFLLTCIQFHSRVLIALIISQVFFSLIKNSLRNIFVEPLENKTGFIYKPCVWYQHIPYAGMY